MSLRRWFARRYLTRVEFRPDPFGRPECCYVERPDWWTFGGASGVTDVTVEAARTRLDAWQDDQHRRARAA